MRKLVLIMVLMLAALNLFGCSDGGAGTGNNSAFSQGGTSSIGSAKITINWAGSKGAILNSAYSVKFNATTQVTDASGAVSYRREVNAIIVTRNASNSSETLTINGIPIGARTIIVQAYNSSGAEIGHASSNVTITQGDNNGLSMNLSEGIFSGTIFGKSDATVPTNIPSYGPYITAISPSGGSYGASVLISGRNFGFSQGASTVEFNGVPARIISWNNTQISCEVPQGTTSGYIMISVDSTNSNSVWFEVTGDVNPSIAGLSTGNGFAGDSVRIYGGHFGSTQGASTVKFFNGLSAPIISWSNIAIDCTVPEGAQSGPLFVTVNGVNSNEENFHVGGAVVVGPVIGNITPAPTAAGTEITITGIGFGNTHGASFVTFGSATAATNIISWSGNQIKCIVPSNLPNGYIGVTVTVAPYTSGAHLLYVI